MIEEEAGPLKDKSIKTATVFTIRLANSALEKEKS